MDSIIESRIQGNVRFRFGKRIKNHLKSLVHWVQYFYCTSEEPNITGLNQVVFISVGKSLGQSQRT